MRVHRTRTRMRKFEIGPLSLHPMSFLSKSQRQNPSASSSEEEDNEDEDEAGDEKKPKKSRGRFGYVEDDKESSEEKVVLKSARDKRLEEVEQCGKSIDSAIKVGDRASIGTGARRPSSWLSCVL